MKSPNGRLSELALIQPHGALIVYGGQAWVSPNRWISNAIVKDFLERKLVEQKDNRIEVTPKGIEVLKQNRKVE